VAATAGCEQLDAGLDHLLQRDAISEAGQPSAGLAEDATTASAAGSASKKVPQPATTKATTDAIKSDSSSNADITIAR
jgi:hypothetical protein